MKELSIEEKAKAYDMAIKKAKSKIKDDKDHVLYEDDIIDLFPELAESESEDEKIRKELLAWLKSRDGQTLPIDRYNAAIAWLEKQGEHANFRNKIQIGDKVTRNQDGVLVNLSQLNRLAKKQGEQKPILKFKVDDVVRSSNGASLLIVGITDYCYNCVISATNDEYSFGFDIQDEFELVEQKPTEWSEEDEHNLFLCSQILRQYNTSTTINSEDLINWIRSLNKKDIILPNKLSEKDDNCICKIINWLDVCKAYNQDSKSIKEISEHIQWLKSLRDRVQPQPKQEWSKEDESHIRYLIECLEHCKKGVSLTMTTPTAQEYIDWLKSLRPQSLWKPSETDIRILEQVIDGTANPISYSATLCVILEHLKKLREE